MKRGLIIGLILFLSLGIAAQTKQKQSSMKRYEQEWSRVEKMDKDALPKSAKAIVDDILKKAIAEHNTQQVIKALIYTNKYKTAINEGENDGIFTDLENLLNTTSDVANKALLHSMLAELYLNYFDAYSWTIRGRTTIVGYVPDDMKEWSKNIFQEKILFHLAASVKDDARLVSTETRDYQDVIVLGEESQRICPTMYDFLIGRAIDLSSRITLEQERSITFLKSLQSKKIKIKDLATLSAQYVKLDLRDDDNLSTLFYYQQALKSLSLRKLNEDIVFVEISKNNYLSNRSDVYSTQYSYDFLLALEKENTAYDYNVEIIDALVNKLQSKNYSLRSTDIRVVQKENLEKIDKWIKYGIQKYPNYKRINILKQKLAQLEFPEANVIGSTVFHSDNANKVFKLQYKNLKEATIKVINKESNTVLETQKLLLSSPTTYLTQDTSFVVNTKKIGNYRLEIEYDKKNERQDRDNDINFSISNFAYFARVSGTDEYEFYVVDRLTGLPLPGATITVYSNEWGTGKYIKLSSVSTGVNGVAKLDTKNIISGKNDLRYVYRVSIGNDSPESYNEFPYYYSYNSDPDYGSDIIRIFTDRSIYRPGQTVYFKAVSTKLEYAKNEKINVDKQYKVSLHDSNGQIVANKVLNTNDFGSLAGEFTIPQRGIPGQYYISVGNSNQYFNVEEYKRPTFQVTFDKLKQTYSFGDSVRIAGHVENFSGIKIKKANVEYSIVRRSFNWWRSSSAETVDNGIIETNDDGSFDILFNIPDNDASVNTLNSIYNFEIRASVTDLNGETQNGKFDFTVGNVSLILSLNLPEQLDKESKDKLEVKATNLNGEMIDVNGVYRLYSVYDNDSVKSEVVSGNFSANKELDLLSRVNKLPSAKYLLVLTCKDDKGRDVVEKKYFVAYSLNDKNPPIKTNEWLIEKQPVFSESKDAEIVFGVSAKEATVLYDLIKENKVIERQHIKLSNENKRILIPYKDAYGDRIMAVFTYVIDEVAYTKEVRLEKEQGDKKLSLKFEVFRDKLRPGQQEEWKISVKDNQGKSVLSELLASMYDSSLDKLLSPTEWIFNRSFSNLQYPSIFKSPSFKTLNEYAHFIGKNDYTIHSLNWDSLNWFGFDFGGSFPHFALRGNALRNKSSINSTSPVPPPSMALAQVPAMNKPMGMMDESLSLDHSLAENSEVIENLSDDANLFNKSNQGAQIRTNFNETAFFYPQLKTNKEGETIISFIVPESNTTWRFRALAYDKSLNSGMLDALIVSRKELMVTPNLPRFLREGDRASISTKISNLSDKTLTGKARLEFFDPLTDKAVNIEVDKYKSFQLEKEASTSVSWLFDVPSGIDMIGVRIVAEEASFSDGEQHVLSVLPNRMLVTESLTMNVNNNQTKDFRFDRFLNNQTKTLSNYKLTLEYTNNPAWYAIQALPTLTNPINENAVNWFASYYANSIGNAIVNQYPKVSNMISAWKKQGLDKQSMISNLQKNEELKIVLLEETPWVLDAKDETEQMNRLSLLFDINNIGMQTTQAISKLEELQNADGGWSWYKDMYSNRSVTQYILYGFSQLIDLNLIEYPYEVKVMQMNALKYIDKQITKDFEDLKLSNKDWNKVSDISTSQLEYLYVRSSYRDIPIDQKAREAEKFYTSVVEKNWTKLSLYEKALLAVLCQREGNHNLASAIIKSLREYSTNSEEMGMYWANNNSRVFMSQSATVVHTFIMEAFRESNAPASEMDLMKQWLLKQRQTQVWESTHATMDAIYALLRNGNDWLSGTGNSTITVGKKVIEPQNKDLGTGYFKESWSHDEINNDMGNITIHKTGDGPAWGAMYWQYYEDLDRITEQKENLNIEKKLFIEKSTDKGSVLKEVSDRNSLEVGDKVIIRLTVRNDRDMEFIHIKDMRAACFEPTEAVSGLKWQNATYYYQATRDASTNFYFDSLPKGTYVFEYPVYVNRAGKYSNGVTTIQSMYAPEFVSHTSGAIIEVK